jgi:Glycosyl hydrolase family 20, catalytic domain
MRQKIKIQAVLILFFVINMAASAQETKDVLFPIKGFCINAPDPGGLDLFIKFIDEELASRGVNTLLILGDYNYQFESYPQLSDSAALSKADVKKIVAACKKNNIKIIPQINMLGHQSWSNHLGNLLTHFPEFDETPHIKMPENYVWPNDDGLYCKSYCPLHPDIHEVLFAVIDEICDVYEADAFHAGMDEIFYLGDNKCPRCKGVDKAELFAGEVNKIKNHLDLKNRELWIWGDRLIDGKSTGLGFWEASYNYTWRAIDMISKDVVICDWHYERPDQTPVYFAMKGFRVVTCPWRTPPTAVLQVEDMAKWRKYATPEMKPRYYGMVQTTWMSTAGFLDGLNGKVSDRAKGAVHPKNPAYTPWDTFRTMFKRMDELEKDNK